MCTSTEEWRREQKPPEASKRKINKTGEKSEKNLMKVAKE
jgi:hypothetical protein